MSVSVREFKANLSRYLKAAQASSHGVEITSHGKVIARVVGLPNMKDDAVRRLIASGAAQWDGCKPVWKRMTLSTGGRDVSSIVLDDRE